ncbi:MAG: molybdopterin-guanine dinucleotide biosynthesis protein B [Firmicutes bacterium]|nr:molybdopterin-guanine dinucleotide biosynthesis protein B [Bacillota bacterium]
MFSVVGRSGSGKTTLIEKLIPELRRRGYRIATIKHDAHGFEIDRPGKDSWRHRRAGAEAVILASADTLAMIRNLDSEPALEEIVRLLEGQGQAYDLIITEGYKTADQPKLEVVNTDLSREILTTPVRGLFGVAADRPEVLDAPAGITVFHRDDGERIADLVEKHLLLGITGSTDS